VLRFFWVAVLFALVLNIVATWLTSTTNIFSESPLGWMLVHFQLTGSIGLALLILTLLIEYVNYRVTSAHAAPMPPTVYKRQHFLKLLQQRYTTGRIQILHSTMKLSLHFTENTDIKHTPTPPVLRHMRRSEQHPREWTSILQAYNESGQGILILGAPGAGKSTLLLDLAFQLLEQVKQEATHPLPVILDLSSWVAKQQSLDTWLIEELYFQYQMSHELGQSWVQADQLFFLLDGLDEVQTSAYSACIKAINAYHTEHFMPLVVSSRSDEYFTQKERLNLPGAVMVEPLTKEQITIVNGTKPTEDKRLDQNGSDRNSFTAIYSVSDRGMPSPSGDYFCLPVRILLIS
jgi:energy-coupling factor transporter ATP-binding protein EcfA2